MRNILLLFLTVFTLQCKGQDTLKQLFFPELGWTIKLDPSKFADTIQFQSIAQKANKAINQTYNTDLDLINAVHPLFTIVDGNYNLFASTINAFDSTLFNTWQQSYAASKKLIIDVLNNQAGIKIIDTLSGREMIDGLRFETFRMKTLYPDKKIIMTTYWFYRKQNQYDFSVNISFTDEQKGKMFLDIFRNSKFTH